jgi:hypothetical protein
MFEFQTKMVEEGKNFYMFNILDEDYEKVGSVGILIGDGRHDATIVFNEGFPTLDAYQYIEDLRGLLDRDLIELDEPHERIIIAEILYGYYNR